MIKSILNLVRNLPSPIKNGIGKILDLAPNQTRYGKTFWNTYKFLQKSQYWNRKKLEEYQFNKLNKLLNHAYSNVPYYNEIMDERGIKPSDIHNIKDLKKLPTLTREDVKKNLGALHVQNENAKFLSKIHTSGTTGEPLQFYSGASARQKELAFIYHQWSRVGVRPGDKMVQMRGELVKQGEPTNFDPILNVLRFSPQVGSQERAEYYLKKIRKFDADYIHGYPSTISDFASTIKRYNLPIRFDLEAILFASENIYSWERELVGEVFDCRVFSHYGLAEQVTLAAECEETEQYHCVPQYGVTEFDTDTNEIIGTGFLNYHTPFIRYRTTDIASGINAESKCSSRDYFPVFGKVEGRLEDYLITPKGLVGPAIITHPFKDLETIKETQIVQESKRIIRLRVVPWENAELSKFEIEAQNLRSDLGQLLGGEMTINMEKENGFKHSDSGKFKWIKSKISDDLLKKGLNELDRNS